MQGWQQTQLGDPWEHLALNDIPTPEPSSGQIRVRVAATDLNFADILQCQGSYQVKLEVPFTPGMNSAGTVTASAPDSGFKPGERVVGPTLGPHGGYAEEAILLASQAHRLPDGVSTTDASAIHVTYGTAWFALHQRGHLQPGETVLVLAGAGGVGSAAIDLAKVHGCWVIAAAGGSEKVETCRSLGADAVIDYTSEDLYERVMTLTDRRGVDVVYDPVGGRYFDIARRLVAWEGRLLVIGFASGTIPTAPANHALVKNYSVVGVHMGGYRNRPDQTPFDTCYNSLHQMLVEGKLSPLVSERIGIRDLPDALHRLANRQTTGRILFEPTR
jgi:NADPH2:quinone reductase